MATVEHTTQAPAMTVEEWAALDEDEPGELVGGRLVEEEMPDAIHELIVAWLVDALRAWGAAGGGVVLGSDAKVALSPRYGRKPDVSLYFAASKKPPRRGVIRVPPDLAVEVVSPKPRDARRDRLEKHEEYAAFGIAHYWLVDPETRIVECHDLAGGRYVRSAAASEGKLAVPGFDGLALDLDELWRETERLADD